MYIFGYANILLKLFYPQSHLLDMLVEEKHRNLTSITCKEDEEEEDDKRILFFCWMLNMELSRDCPPVNFHFHELRKWRWKKKKRNDIFYTSKWMTYFYIMFCISECADRPLAEYLHACSIRIDHWHSANPIYYPSVPTEIQYQHGVTAVYQTDQTHVTSDNLIY